MASLSFAGRCWIAIGGALAVCSAVWVLLGGSWWGIACAGIVTGALLWGVSRSLAGFVTEQHGHFSLLLESLQHALATGQRVQLLRSERPADSFGRLAAGLNQVAEVVLDETTQLRRRNQQLQQDQMLFQSILGTMGEGILVLDARQAVVFCNPAGRRMLDCDSRHLEGRPLWEVLRAPEMESVVNSVAQTGAELRREVQLKRTKSIIEFTAVKLPLSPQPGLMLVLQEVTELRRLERLRREFVSNVSHELKTPLTSIQAYADTLLDGGLEDVEHRESFVGRIVEQASRLQKLIQDMLRLARIESQSEAFELRPLPVRPIVEACLASRQPVAESRGVTLQLVAGADLEVFADAEGLRTILDNLVTNAIHYSHSGGVVEVAWQATESAVCLSVSDQGVGIPAEHRERIFERFFRVDRARSRELGGTGLGLAIVKHLVDVFEGQISVESEVGRGSVFRVWLPRCAESRPTDSGKSAPHPAPSA